MFSSCSSCPSWLIKKLFSLSIFIEEHEDILTLHPMEEIESSIQRESQSLSG
jgi:hypothetical protein